MSRGERNPPSKARGQQTILTEQGALFAASGPPNPFAELLAAARAGGLARALRTPVDRFARSRGLGDGSGRALRCGGEVMHGQTVEAFVAHAASLVASRPVWMRHPEVRALLTELEGFLGEAQAESAMQALAVPAPPDDEGKLLAWAKQHRVEDELTRRVSALFARFERSKPGVRSGGVRSSSALDVLVRRVEAPAAFRVQVADWLWARAERRALAVQEEGARLALVHAEPTTASLRTFCVALETARGLVRRGAWPEPRKLVRVHDLERDLDAQVVRAQVDVADEPTDATVRVVSADVRELGAGAVVVRCDCGAPACCHALAFIDHLWALATDEHAPAAHQLRELLETAPWQRALERVQQQFGALARNERRGGALSQLAFHLEPRGGQILAPIPHLLRRRQEGGPWEKRVQLDTKGRARELESFGPRAPLLGALIDGGRAYGKEFDALRFEALVQLIGHEHVYILREDAFGGVVGEDDEDDVIDFDPSLDDDVGGGDSNYVALTVREGTLEARTELRGEDVTLVPVVAGDPALGRAVVERMGDAPRVMHVAQGCLWLVRVEPAQRALFSVLSEREVAFPKASHGPLLATLAPLSDRLRLDAHALPTVDHTPPDDTFVLRLEPAPGVEPALLATLSARPAGPRSEVPPGAGPTLLHAEVDGRVRIVERRLADERARAEVLAVTLGLTQACAWPAWHVRLPADAALPVVARLRDQAPPGVVVEWRKDAWQLSRAASPGDLRMSVSKDCVSGGRDWFGVQGELNIDGMTVSVAALLQALSEGREFVRVGDAQWVHISAALKRWLDALGDHVEQDGDALLARPSAVLGLGDLLDSAHEVRLHEAWSGLRARVRASFDAPLVVPQALRAELRPYQAEGVRWLLRLASWGVGGVLADDMGLGKTLQALAVLLAREASGPALVVAPTSVCFNWVREAQRFAPSLRVHVLAEAKGRGALVESLGAGDLLIASYGLVVQERELLAQKRFATLVLDEAQNVKNAASQRARATRDLQSEWRFALSGTPMENHLGELWSVMRVVQPGLFGSLESFRRRFALPIERGDDRRREDLARLLRPFVLRRTKSMVAPELPPRIEIVREIELSVAERERYEAVRLSALSSLGAAPALAAALPSPAPEQRFAVLAALTRLRQLACHPRLADPSYEGDSAKLTELMFILTELREESHRALVFSQFTTHLALARQAIEAAGLSYQYLDGETPTAERARRVDAFQRGEGDVFLISLKAGGVGLNLTAADYVVHLDPWWNPAAEDQATDRAHRIGQTRPVTVYRLVAKGTIEETILALHADKRALVEGVLEGASTAAQLSTEQLVSLIRGP